MLNSGIPHLVNQATKHSSCCVDILGVLKCALLYSFNTRDSLAITSQVPLQVMFTIKWTGSGSCCVTDMKRWVFQTLSAYTEKLSDNAWPVDVCVFKLLSTKHVLSSTSLQFLEMTTFTGKTATSLCHTSRRFMMTSHHFPNLIQCLSPPHTHSFVFKKQNLQNLTVLSANKYHWIKGWWTMRGSRT